MGIDSLIDAVERSLPSYRAQHRALNVAALEVGHDSVTTRPGTGLEMRSLRPRAQRRDRGRVVVSRGTLVIDVDACKGCDLCIDACPPGVLVMTTHQVNGRGYRYPS